jgi:hypothetical protein
MGDRFTALRVADGGGVPLFEGHVRRLGESCRSALGQFAAEAVPGVYRVSWNGSELTATLRGPSKLVEGMPVRFVVSPFAGQRGRFPKPGPPSPYEGVRVEGVATLLTDAAGEELYESSVSGLVAWDGSSLVLPPEDVPAVASVAEAEVAERLVVRRGRLMVRSEWPLLLINAVVGTCAVELPGRPAFPADQRRRLDEVVSRPPVLSERSRGPNS